MYGEHPEGKDYGLERCQKCNTHGVDPETRICYYCNQKNEAY